MNLTLPPEDSQLAWQQTLDKVEPVVREHVADVAFRHAARFSDVFYDAMLGDSRGSTLLDHSLVNDRLHASMIRWVVSLFDPDARVEDNIAVQVRIADVHARIGVPMELVSRAARVLKRAITHQLIEEHLPREELAEAIHYVYELVDIAVDTMNAAYARQTMRMARTDEAYRRMFVGQDMKAERERQRTQLLEWANDILTRCYGGLGSDPQPIESGITASQFGLWLQHKASILFAEATELEHIQVHIDAIDRELLGSLRGAGTTPDQVRSVVTQVKARIDTIKALLGTMFDRFIEAEDGRDSVTRLLNRRYFPTVIRREIDLAIQQRGQFALLLIDLDHFRDISDRLGLQGADLALAQVASILLDNVRAGDFVFRAGDDQFLVLLVESTPAGAMGVAEGLRARIAASPLRHADRGGLTLSVSIGIAMFDGHPDYQRLLDRSADALRRAKADGRDRCVMAD